MSRKRSIVERFLPGEECDLTRIDGEIDAWHEADTTVPLHEWLGLTSDEYQLHVEKPVSICIILAARDQNRSLKGLFAAKNATPHLDRHQFGCLGELLDRLFETTETSRDQALPVMPVGEKNAPVLANRRVVKGLDSGDIDWRRLRQP